MIKLNKESILAAYMIPAENGVNIGITVDGHQHKHMWIITPEMLAGILKGDVVAIQHAVRPDDKPEIITSVSQAVKNEIGGGRH